MEIEVSCFTKRLYGIKKLLILNVFVLVILITCGFSVNVEIQHYNATFELPQNEAELEQVFKAFRIIYNEGSVQFQSGHRT